MRKTVAASILGIENKAKIVNELIDEEISWIHYDVMDGHFVENTSLPIDEIRSIVKTTKKHIVDIHLMVEDVEEYIEECEGLFDYITFHYEALPERDIESILRKYEDVNIGISVNPSTPIEKIFTYLDDVSHILIMSVVPGKGGQSFIEATYEKVQKLKAEIKARKLNVLIQVDGGINDKNGPYLINDGADVLVSGSYLTKNISKRTWQTILAFMC